MATNTIFLQFRVGGNVLFDQPQTIQLHQQGVVQLLGKNKDTGGSNGSGKSMLLNLFADFVLGGSTFSAPEFLSQNGNFFRELTFKRGDASYRFVEYKNFKGKKTGYELYRDETLFGPTRIPECRKFIRDFFGWTESEFYGSIYFEQNGIHTLVNGTSTDRRKYIENLFNLELFDKMAQSVKDELGMIGDSLADLRVKREMLEQQKISLSEMLNGRTPEAFEKFIQSASTELEHLNQDVAKQRDLIQRGEAIRQAVADRKALLDQVADLKGQIAEISETESVESLRSTLKDLEVELNGLALIRSSHENFQRSLKTHGSEAAIRKIIDKEKSVGVRRQEFATILREAKNRLRQFQNLESGVTCQSCGQEVSEHHVEDCITIEQKKVSQLTQELGQLGDPVNVESLQRILSSKPAETLDLDRITKLEKKKSNLQDRISQAAHLHNLWVSLHRLSDKIDRLPSGDIPLFDPQNLSGLENRRDALVQKLATIKTRYSMIQTKIDEISDLENEISKANSTQERNEVLVALTKAYGPKGLKLKTLRMIASNITKVLPRYSSLLFRGGEKFLVSEDSDTSFDIHCKRPNVQPFDVKFCSGGEKARLISSLVFTLNDICAPAKRANLIILDELDASLDETGRKHMQENLLPALRERFGTVIFVSHAETQSAHFDQTWTVTKKSNRSAVSVSTSSGASL